MLQDRIAAFRKQQERVQALSVSHASATQRATVRQHGAAPPAQGQKPALSAGEAVGPTAAVTTQAAASKALDPKNWMQDQDFYAARIAVQRLTLAHKIKKVIEHLFKERRELTADEIEDQTFVDVTTNAELGVQLRNNPKIAVEGDKFRYKAKHEIKDSKGLLHLIREHKDGIPFADVKDSYTQVGADVESLRASGLIWVLSNSDTHDTTLYPNDPKIQIRVDVDIRELFRSVEVPRDFKDVEMELKRCGQTPVTSAAREKLDAATAGAIFSTQQKPRQKRRRESKRTRYTNAHLPELFKDLPPA